MEKEKKMQYCASCDVYVGESDDGRLVVVAGDTFRWYVEISQQFVSDCGCKDSYTDDLLNCCAWEHDAAMQLYQGMWLEPDDVERGWWWYRACGLDELHDHSLWLESFSR